MSSAKPLEKMPVPDPFALPLPGLDADPVVLQQQWLQRIAFLDGIAAPNQILLFLFDVVRSRFVYMSERIKAIGHEPLDYTQESGVAFWNNHVHPQHMKTALSLYNLAFTKCADLAQQAFRNIFISINYLYRAEGGMYFQLLQTSFIAAADAVGNPLLVFGYGYDITHLVKKDSVGLVIRVPNKVAIWSHNHERKQLETVTYLTSKEQGILKLLSKGKSTKEISDVLNISPHTVDTHRRNLLRKLNCIDTTALITYAKMVGII